MIISDDYVQKQCAFLEWENLQLELDKQMSNVSTTNNWARNF